MADVTDSPELGRPAPAESGGPAGRAHSWPVRGWLRYRAWRRSRPFWAGIWLIIAGAELLLIPLPIHHIGIIVHIGFGGIAGILIGAVLILIGLLLWISPAQRVFYSSVAVLLAVAALVASNLGGFLIGTLLGIIGASLGFAWMPGRPERRRRRRQRQQPDVPDGGLALFSDADADTEALTNADTISGADSETGVGTAAGTGGATPGEQDAAPGSAITSAPPGTEHPTISREFVLLPALALLAGVVHLTPLTGTATPSPSVSATPSASASADPSPAISASPSAPAPSAPAPSASTSSSAPNPVSTSTSASPEPSASAGSSSSASATSTASPAPSASPSSTPTGTPPAFEISTNPATLTASSASLTGFAYDGVVSVPTASGSVQMMEFSATSIDLSGAQLAVSEGGNMMTTTASSLNFDGNVVLYATVLSGDLLGSPVTITPSTPLATVLQLLGQVGASQLISLQMTNVTTQQPYTSANSLAADSLLIS